MMSIVEVLRLVFLAAVGIFTCAAVYLCCFRESPIYCTKCGARANIVWERGVWECPKCGYGKYVECWL